MGIFTGLVGVVGLVVRLVVVVGGLEGERELVSRRFRFPIVASGIDRTEVTVMVTSVLPRSSYFGDQGRGEMVAVVAAANSRFAESKL